MGEGGEKGVDEETSSVTALGVGTEWDGKQVGTEWDGKQVGRGE